MKDAYAWWCREQEQLKEIESTPRHPLLSGLIGANRSQAEFQRVSKTWHDMSVGNCDAATRLRAVETQVKTSERLDGPEPSPWPLTYFQSTVPLTGAVTYAYSQVGDLDHELLNLNGNRYFVASTSVAKPSLAKPSPITDRTPPQAKAAAAPPGGWMLMLSQFLMSRRSRERIVEPIVRDMRDEYSDAMSSDRRLLATVVRIRGVWSFVSAIVQQFPFATLLRWAGLSFAAGASNHDQ